MHACCRATWGPAFRSRVRELRLSRGKAPPVETGEAMTRGWAGSEDQRVESGHIRRRAREEPCRQPRVFVVPQRSPHVDNVNTGGAPVEPLRFRGAARSEDLAADLHRFTLVALLHVRRSERQRHVPSGPPGVRVESPVHRENRAPPPPALDEKEGVPRVENVALIKARSRKGGLSVLHEVGNHRGTSTARKGRSHTIHPSSDAAAKHHCASGS